MEYGAWHHKIPDFAATTFLEQSETEQTLRLMCVSLAIRLYTMKYASIRELLCPLFPDMGVPNILLKTAKSLQAALENIDGWSQSSFWEITCPIF